MKKFLCKYRIHVFIILTVLGAILLLRYVCLSKDFFLKIALPSNFILFCLVVYIFLVKRYYAPAAIEEYISSIDSLSLKIVKDNMNRDCTIYADREIEDELSDTEDDSDSLLRDVLGDKKYKSIADKLKHASSDTPTETAADTPAETATDIELDRNLTSVVLGILRKYEYFELESQCTLIGKKLLGKVNSFFPDKHYVVLVYYSTGGIFTTFYEKREEIEERQINSLDEIFGKLYYKKIVFGDN